MANTGPSARPSARQHPKPAPSPWLSAITSIPQAIWPGHSHETSAQVQTPDSLVKSPRTVPTTTDSCADPSPLDRLREDLERRETLAPQEMPRIVSRTFQDLQQGLQGMQGLEAPVPTLGRKATMTRTPTFTKSPTLTRNPTMPRVPTGMPSGPRLTRKASILETVLSLPAEAARKVSATKSKEVDEFETERLALLKEFRKHEGTSRTLNLAEFKKALSVRGEAFAEALFRKLDMGRKGYVLDEDLVTAILTLHRDTLENRIAFTFELLDADGSGSLSRDEMVAMLKASCSESRIALDDAEAQKLAGVFFTHLGKQAHEEISKEEFVTMLQGDANLQKGIKLAGLNLKPRYDDDEVQKEELKRHTSSLHTIERFFLRVILFFRISRPTKVFWMTIFLIGQAMGFWTSWVDNDKGVTFTALGWAYPIAKASAGAIQVVVALFLFPVARGMLTFIRSTPLKKVIPVDQSIQMHKFLAYCFFFWSWLHSVAHFVNSAHATQAGHLAGVYGRLTNFYVNTCGNSSATADMNARQSFQNVGVPLQPGSFQPVRDLSGYYLLPVQITGCMLLGIISIAYLWALKYPRQLKIVKGTFLNRIFNNFAWFYITHLFMTVTVVVLLVIHPWPGKGHLKAAVLTCAGPAKSSSRDPSLKNHHGITWMYLTAGVVVFLIERLLRTWRRAAWDVSLSSVRLHAGNIIELRLTNPRRTRASMARRFNYRPGQYCFLNVPKLSRVEWHPFSITSCPDDNHISFHIAAAGDWTRALQALMRELTGGDAVWTRLGHQLSYKVVSGDVLDAKKSSLQTEDSSILDVNPFAESESLQLGTCKPILESDAGRPMLDSVREDMAMADGPDLEAGVLDIPLPSITRAPKISIDGPFGAPAQNYRDYEILLLVGAGVGITPMASILRTLVREYEMAKCRRCGLMNERLFTPKKVYFYWITREQQAPTWFQSTLEAIQNNEEYARFLDIHVHFSSALAADDLRATIVKVAQNLYHKENGYDVLSGCGMSFPICFGRPNWDKIFADIAKNHAGQLVGTFYCGNAVVGKQLKGLCTTWNKAGPPDKKSMKLMDGTKVDMSENSIASSGAHTRPARFDFYKESF